ncbi:DUF1501 domain-containing protein [Persicirhabdus sediminis]|uniref:DUF1501 domain-containing protein n=1 Tax=Persicirhabdus sediminis TaxID=454144 RepID=A0A8J7SIJ8_9BACT|nr:DUF1501 domain-containing protein [Persicirhabdus sediminis]MBK1790496.1 DUF1501 domain-containing protein [Persicirhabdus sediminis]
MNTPNRGLSRRAFIRQSACASLGISALVNSITQLKLLGSAVASTDVSTSDYKALICIFLAGGNDSANMIFPIGDPATDEVRADYEAARRDVAQPKLGDEGFPLEGTILSLPNGEGGSQQTKAFDKHYAGQVPAMGVNPRAPELAEMFNDGDLAFVCNVGSLVEPIISRDAYIQKEVARPKQLFSHSNQQKQWQTSIADEAMQTGWGGRIADLLHSSGSSDKVSMLVSMAGINSFEIAGGNSNLSQYVMSTNGAEPYSGYGSSASPYSNAYANGVDASSGYLQTDTGRRLAAFEGVMNNVQANLMDEEYYKRVRSSRNYQASVEAALIAASATGVDFDEKFANANSSLGRQLKMVAKLIAGRQQIGNARQIFFCRVGGYDNHSGLLENHGNVMAELSSSIAALRDTLKDPAVDCFDSVTTFTSSDFSRTLNPNASSGTDHAWAGHCIVMGGAVNGGDLYGHFPSLKLGDQEGSIDSHSSRGLLIPDVSVDQYSAVIASWFGVESTEMETAFPYLYRFDDPFTVNEMNLKFL